MVQSSAHLRINLNKKTKLPLENIAYVWAINGGRLLILITEVVALGALFFRFVVDQQILDQQDQINKDRGIVVAEAGQEARFRDVQQKLTIVKNVQAQSSVKLTIMSEILQASNNGQISSPQISIDNNQITLNATTPQINMLSQFVDTMKSHPEVESINIDDIGSSSDQGIAFQLSIGLKESSQ